MRILLLDLYSIDNSRWDTLDIISNLVCSSASHPFTHSHSPGYIPGIIYVSPQSSRKMMPCLDPNPIWLIFSPRLSTGYLRDTEILASRNTSHYWNIPRFPFCTYQYFHCFDLQRSISLTSMNPSKVWCALWRVHQRWRMIRHGQVRC